MSSARTGTIFSILKGLLLAAGFTLLGMLLIAALTLFAHLSDNLLLLLNQLLKAVSIILGTIAAVGRGGSRGFVTGAVTAMIYMILGYGFYIILGGGVYSFASMLGEMLLGAAVGAVTGAFLANMRPRKRSIRRT